MPILDTIRTDLSAKTQRCKGFKKNSLVLCVLAFLCFVFPEVVYGEEIVTFEMLSNHSLNPSFYELEDKEISIKGFYYESNRGESYLASQPNLKSCCVGSIDKLDRQVLLEKHFILPKSKAVTLRGVLKTSPTYNEQGDLLSIYSLKNPVIVQEGHNNLFYVMMFCLMIVVFVFFKKTIYKYFYIFLS